MPEFITPEGKKIFVGGRGGGKTSAMLPAERDSLLSDIEDTSVKPARVGHAKSTKATISKFIENCVRIAPNSMDNFKGSTDKITFIKMVNALSYVPTSGALARPEGRGIAGVSMEELGSHRIFSNLSKPMMVEIYVALRAYEENKFPTEDPADYPAEEATVTRFASENPMWGSW